MKAFKSKLVAVITACSLCVPSAIPVFAAVDNTEDVTAPTDVSCSIVAEVATEWTVTIPKQITLDVVDEVGTADYQISVKGNIANDHAIIIKPDSGFNMVQDDINIPATVSQAATEFRRNEFTLDTAATTTGSIRAEGLTAGVYTGNLNFHVSERDHEHTYENGVCTQCNEVDPNHTHNYENGVCTICAEIDPNHTHNYEHGKCTICNELDPDHVHSYESGVCTDCGYECTHTFVDNACTECGVIDPNHAHSYENAHCTICGELDPNHEHSYTEEITTPATCDAAGEKTLTCVCGDTKTEAIEAIGHNYVDGACSRCDQPCPHNWNADDVCADCGALNDFDMAPVNAYRGYQYELDETNKTITLKHYIEVESKVIVYAHYPIGDVVYTTKLEPSMQLFNPTDHANCKNIRTIKFSPNIDTSNVTNLGGSFSGLTSLRNVDLRGFNSENVTNMASMFNGCTYLSACDLSSFRTSNVQNMALMFSGCSSLTSVNLTSFDTSNVTTMTATFQNCSALTELDLTSFNISKVASLYRYFYNCSRLKTIRVTFGQFNTTGHETSEMFTGCGTSEFTYKYF